MIQSLATVASNVTAVLGPVRTNDVLARRLAEMGMRPGTEVTALLRTAGGGRVIAVGDSRIALDRQTALALSVEVGETE